MSGLKTTIPKGSWVLITGVTGHVASELARQFLERGYRVRGTARDLAKASWLVNDVFKDYVDKGYFELTHVPYIDAEGGFDASVKGVSAIAHVATIGFDPDPNKVVTPTVAATVSVLKAALREPSVKQFVYTSSIVSHTSPFPGNTTHVTPDTWNDDISKVAWAPPPYDESRIFPVYMASKTEAERALWKFVADEKPHFQVNSVSPQTIFGKRLNKNGSSPTASLIPQLYEGKAANDFLQASTYLDSISFFARTSIPIQIHSIHFHPHLHAYPTLHFPKSTPMLFHIITPSASTYTYKKSNIQPFPPPK